MKNHPVDASTENRRWNEYDSCFALMSGKYVWRFNDNMVFNPLTTSVPRHIETSQLICNANQLTGFSMMGNAGY